MLKDEYGRSFVEMIGVLALIGCLSIASVVGYSHAIKKYWANSLINEILIRKTDLLAQNLVSRKLSLFSHNFEKYVFAEPIIDDENLISLTVLNVEKEVCKIVFDKLKRQMVYVEINSLFARNSDVCSQQTNKMTFYFNDNLNDLNCETDVCFNTSEQPIIYYCSDNSKCGECQFCDIEEKVCKFLEEEASCDNEQGICINGDCVYQECTKNSDCKSDEYCSGSNTSQCEQLPFRCKKIDFSKIKLEFSDKHIETWFVSRTQISYWDAKSACEKMGKKMVTVDELVENYPSEMILPRTERLVLLNDKLGRHNVWTNEEYNVCYSISIFSGSGYTINMINTEKDRRFALCR